MLSEIELMLEQSKLFDQRKHDHLVKAREICFDEQSNMILPAEMLMGKVIANPLPLEPTDWAYGQLFRKLSPYVLGPESTLPKRYLLAIDPDLRAYNLNRHMKEVEADTEWMVRGYDDSARAVLSTRYTDVSNTQVLEMLVSAMEKTNVRNSTLVRSVITPDELILKTVWRDVNDKNGGSWGVGFAVQNGEVGNRTIRIDPLIQRHSCTNSIIPVTDQGVHVKHFGNFDILKAKIVSVLQHIFKLSFEWLEQMIKAEEDEIDDFEAVLDQIASQYGMNDKQRMAFAVGTEGQQTRAGIVYGLSYMAHTTTEDPSEMIEWEMLAGQALTSPRSVFNFKVRETVDLEV